MPKTSFEELRESCDVARRARRPRGVPDGAPAVIIGLAQAELADAVAPARRAGRVLFVDDEGTASGGEMAREFPGLEVIRTERPLWWTGCIALGVERALEAGDPAVLFFNQDVTCAGDYLDRLAEAAALFPGAILGSAILYAHDPGSVWSAGGAIEWWGRGVRGLHHRANVSQLPAEPFQAGWLFGMGSCRGGLLPDAFPTRASPGRGRHLPPGEGRFPRRAAGEGWYTKLALRPRRGETSTKRCISWMKDPKHNLSPFSHAAPGGTTTEVSGPSPSRFGSSSFSPTTSDQAFPEEPREKKKVLRKRGRASLG
jgi:hypothetical protein